SSDLWWRRLERHRTASWSDLRIAQSGAYNRVEGLPVAVGPTVYQRLPWGSVRTDAAAIVRTSSSFNGASSDIGHDVRLELRAGRRAGVGIGGRLFNVVEPVESWQLPDNEAALASFLFHRDYRDHFQRHGARVFANVFGGRDATLTAGLSDERWVTRDLHDPF